MVEAAGSAGDGLSVFVAFITEHQWERVQSVGEDLIQYATGRVSAGAASQAKSLISAVII